MIERTDREEEISPADIICPPDYYVYNSPFVSEFLAFTVKRKFEKLKLVSELIMSSDDDSYEQFYNTRKLSKLITRDPRLGDQLDSQVVTRLVHFLEHKKFTIQCYSAVVLSYIVSSKHGNVFKDKSIPCLLNCIPSPNTFVQIQALATLIELANAYPDSCDTMIKNGVLEHLESLFTNKENIVALKERGGELLAAICRMKQQLPSDMIIKVVRIISTAIVSNSELVLIQICLVISILSDRRFVETGFQVRRLLDLIDHPAYKVVISAIRTIGNYVRWGNDENIQFMIERGLLLHLGKVLCHEYTIVRKEACWIISNITAVANNSHIQEVIDMGLIDMLVRLVRTDEFEVKEVAACAVFNAVFGSDEKQFTYLIENFFPLVDEVRSFCHVDQRVVALCSKILQLGNITYCTETLSGISTPVTKTDERLSIRRGMTSGTIVASPPDFLVQSFDLTEKMTKVKKLSTTASSSVNSTGNLGSEEIGARGKASLNQLHGGIGL